MEIIGNDFMSVMDQPSTTGISNAGTPQALSREAGSSIGHETIACFLLDADPKSRSSLAKVLAEQGIRLFEFNALERFQSLVAKEPIGFVIARIHLNREEAKLSLSNSRFSDAEQLMGVVRSRGWHCPVIVISDSQDIQECSSAFRAGVFAYLQDLVSEATLLEHIEAASKFCRQRIGEVVRKRDIAEKLSLLTAREREVLDLLVAGQSMKAIASNSRTSFQAVARHRQRILEKLRLEGDVALVRWYFNLAAQ